MHTAGGTHVGQAQPWHWLQCPHGICAACAALECSAPALQSLTGSAVLSSVGVKGAQALGQKSATAQGAAPSHVPQLVLPAALLLPALPSPPSPPLPPLQQPLQRALLKLALRAGVATQHAQLRVPAAPPGGRL